TSGLRQRDRAGRRRRLRHDFFRDVAAAAEIHPQRLDRVDRAPRNAPPAEQQGHQREADAFAEGTFAGFHEIDVRGTLERHDQNRDAVLIHDEAPAAADLVVHLFVRETFDTDDLHLNLPRDFVVMDRPQTCRIMQQVLRRAQPQSMRNATTITVPTTMQPTMLRFHRKKAVAVSAATRRGLAKDRLTLPACTTTSGTISTANAQTGA